MPDPRANETITRLDVNIKSGRMDVLSEFVAELNSDVRLVGRLLLGEARIALHTH